MCKGFLFGAGANRDRLAPEAREVRCAAECSRSVDTATDLRQAVLAGPIISTEKLAVANSCHAITLFSVPAGALKACPPGSFGVFEGALDALAHRLFTES